MMISVKNFERGALVLGAVILASIIVPVTADTGRYEFVATWGSYGTGDGQFNNPYGIHVDNNTGFIYVADTWNDRIQKFTSDGTFVTEWGSYGTGEGDFYFPSSIAINSSGYIYVLDTGNHRVQQFSSDDVFVRSWGSLGTGEGQFDSPDCITVNLTSGHIYVADTWNDRIQKFTSDGTFVTEWGSYGNGNGQFNLPEGIRIDQTSGNVYVVDTGNNRVQKFTSNGTYITSWGSDGTGNGQFLRAYSLTVDNRGNVYVTDTQRNDVQKFTSDGTYITSWGSYGIGNGHFAYPFSISLDNSSTYIYTVEGANDRVQKFKWLTPTPPSDGKSSESIASVSKVKAGESVTLNLKGTSALNDIVVTLNENVASILATSEEASPGPDTFEALDNDVYQYIDVNVFPVSGPAIEEVVLEFKIPKVWFEQNGYGLGDIAMMHYDADENTWQQIPTEFVKEENGIVYYRAVSPGLSYFAISYVENGTVTAEETVEETLIVAEPTAEETLIVAEPTAEATVEETPVTVAPTAEPTTAETPGFTAFGVLAGLAVAFIVLKKR